MTWIELTFAVAPASVTFAGFHAAATWLIFGGLVVGVAVTVTGLGARMALEVLGNSDALYHDVQHTMFVTLVGQEILRGRHLKDRVTPDEWLHYTIALLCHDIGYGRGICPGDTADSYVIDGAGNRVELSGWEYWRLTEDGLAAQSKGHFNAADFERQVAGG